VPDQSLGDGRWKETNSAAEDQAHLTLVEYKVMDTIFGVYPMKGTMAKERRSTSMRHTEVSIR